MARRKHTPSAGSGSSLADATFQLACPNSAATSSSVALCGKLIFMAARAVRSRLAIALA